MVQTLFWIPCHFPLVFIQISIQCIVFLRLASTEQGFEQTFTLARDLLQLFWTLFPHTDPHWSWFSRIRNKLLNLTIIWESRISCLILHPKNSFFKRKKKKEKKGYFLTGCLAKDGFGVVGLLGFGVFDREVFGVDGLLDREPERRSGNLWGDALLLSEMLIHHN